MISEQLKKALCCPYCAEILEEKGGFFICAACSRRYRHSGQAIIFDETGSSLPDDEVRPDSLVFKFKNQLKNFPGLFRLLYRLIYPFVGISARKFIKGISSDSLIINIGSGVVHIHPRVVDVDFIEYPNVSIVADARHLPFKDGSLDAVISESLLEHLIDSDVVAAEMKRVLKPGGLLYIVTPFMLGFHSSPNDYRRWTTGGLKELFQGFSPVSTGVAFGPTSAMTTLIIEWLAMVLSFGFAAVYQLLLLCFMVLLIPVNWLDFIVSRYPFATNNAMAIYYIGRKM